MTDSNRLYFLDNLRAAVILLVVVLHGSMSYMAYAPPWWYVVDTQTSLFFTALVLLVDVPIMLMMFFVAGYFALPSLRKRGAGHFARDKFIRVGAPWLFGVLVLAPPTAYMIYYSRGVPMTLLEFWRTDFWGDMYQQSVYWFLGILFTLFLMLSLAYRLGARLPQPDPQGTRPTWRLFLLFGGLMTAGFLVMNLFYPLDTWSRAGYLFVFQPERLPLYVGYFGLGIYAYRRDWFSSGGYRPRPGPWLVLWAVAGLLYLASRLVVVPVAPQALLVKAANAILFNTFCLASLLAGAAAFARWLNTPGLFWRTQAAHSYGIYYVHPLILYPLAYLFLGVALPLPLKAPLVILTAILLSWAVTALVLKKAPLLQRVF